MKLKSFFKRLILVEEVLEKFTSSVNGEILIFEDVFGKHSMRIGGVSQSGGLVIDIWKNALKVISNKQLVIRNCLVLGLGCGGSAKLVSQKWPEAKITGVEIDLKVIEVGKKYFELSKINNLEIEIADAIKIIHNSKFIIHNSKFDLILIDLYLGKNFPKEAESEEFIKNLKNILSEKGIVVFNRFYWAEYKKQAREFEEKLEKYFPKVWTKRTVSNLLIFCRK